MIYPLSRWGRFRSWFRWLFSRWFVATVLDRSDQACWVDLATWALRHDTDPEEAKQYGVPLDGGPACRVESAITGNCYCGKFVNGCLRSNPAEVSS